LDILQAGNGYNRGRYELTHAPMDSDLARDSKYFGILRERRADLDFLMPQFYNGSTRAGRDGFDGSGAGQIKASTIYSSLANYLFDREPNKVVFGHCISDCSGTGSNVDANQAVQIQKQIKAYNNGEFRCNGGAFFWVANHDVGGAWSDQVVREVSLTSGCSKSQPTPTNPPTPAPGPPPPSPTISPPSPSPPSPTPTGRGDWETCTSSNQCRNQCCSGKYSGGVLKCTPVGGFKPSEGCVGSSISPDPPSPSPPSPSPPSPTPTGLGDWVFCTNSNQCKNQCCSKKYSTSDGRLKCTPVGGFKPWEGCVGSATRYLRRNNEDEEEVVTISDETTGDAAPLEDFELGLGSDVGYGDADEMN